MKTQKLIDIATNEGRALGVPDPIQLKAFVLRELYAEARESIVEQDLKRYQAQAQVVNKKLTD